MTSIFRGGVAFFLIGLIVLAVTGCISWPFHKKSGPLQETDLSELIHRLNARTTQVKSLKALMTIQMTGHQPITASLNWVRPQQIRLTGFGSFGRTMFELIVDDGSVWWSEMGRPAVLLGPVESLRHKEVLGAERLPMAIEDLIDVALALTGPVLEEGEIAAIEEEKSFYILHGMRVEGDQGRLTKRLWIERKKLRLVRKEFFRGEISPVLLIHFDDYRDTVQGDWPHQLVVERPEENGVLRLLFREIKFNFPIAAGEIHVADHDTP